MSLGSRLRKLGTCSSAERRLLLEALFWLGLFSALIRWVSFRRIAVLFKLSPGEAANVLSALQVAKSAQIGRAVQRVAAHTFWTCTCLGQALTGAVMLRRRRIPGTLALGVAHDRVQPDGVAAHAWIQCGDAIVVGSGGHERYTIIGRFVWK